MISINKVKQLREELKLRKLSTTGRKAELIDRLVESLKTENGIKMNCRIILHRIDMAAHTKEIMRTENENTNGTKMMTRSQRKKCDDNSLEESSKLQRNNGQRKKPEKEEKQTEKKKNDNVITDIAAQSDQPNKRRRVEATKPRSPQRKSKKATGKVAATALCLKPALRQYEMVWAHIKGFRNWPGIIEHETPKGKYKIHFFGDYSTSEVSKNKIMHLLEGFKDYATAKKPTALLYKAITEAQMFILDNDRTACPICEMFKLKANETTNQ